MEKFLCNGGQAIIPLFQECAEDPTLPDLIGSGVLVRFGPAFFLFTAAHVLDHAKNSDLLLPSTQDKMIVLNGRGGISASADPARQSDRFDCGWVQLSSEAAAAISDRFKFLDVRDLILDDLTESDSEYCVSGYPVHRTKRVYTLPQAVNFSLLNYNTQIASIKAYRKCGADSNCRVAVHHSKGKAFALDGRSYPADDPHGMSGGAIWKWVEDPEKGFQLRYLSAITAEKDVHNAVIIGTKIAFLIESIRAHIPELSPWLPASESLDIVCIETPDGANPKV